MAYRIRTDRSTETPMDFEFTSRPSSNTKPVWAKSGEDPHTPRKRTHEEAHPATPSFPTPSTPSWPRFGQNNNVPFLFAQNPPQTPPSYPWAPPPHSPAFPQPDIRPPPFPQPELNDVDMADSSPHGRPPTKEKEPEKANEEKEEEGERTMAVGALRRVFKKRQVRERSQVRRRRAHVDDDESSGEESGEESYQAIRRKTTNHYTLNLAGPSGPPSDFSFRALGILQVVFNGTLGALALWLLFHFIFMVNRDVEHRVSEYSMEIVQEIAQCNLAYTTNLCDKNRVPAMAAQCAAWELCMNRDPTKVGRAKVSFEVVGEIINTFVEQISWKTFAFTICSLAFFTFFVNSVIVHFRSRTTPHPSMPPHVPYPLPPAVAYPGPHGYLPQPEWNAKHWKRSESEEEIARQRRRLEDGQAVKVK